MAFNVMQECKNELILSLAMENGVYASIEHRQSTIMDDSVTVSLIDKSSKFGDQNENGYSIMQESFNIADYDSKIEKFILKLRQLSADK